MALHIKITSTIISMARSGRQNYAVGFRTLSTYKSYKHIRYFVIWNTKWM